jgi:3-phenylpropionate/trans-cinnamate dioxygenase ferredoxin subunit
VPRPMASPRPASSDVLAVCPLRALQADGARWVQDGVALIREGDRVYAFEELCPHAGANLVEGEVRRGALSCPQHRARFRLSDGKVLSGPSKRPLVCYDVEQSGEDLLVRPRVPAVAPAGWVHRLRAWLSAQRT